MINIFEKDRNTIMYNLSQLSKNRDEEIKRKARERAEKIRREQETSNNNQDNTNQDASDQDQFFADVTETYEKEIADKNAEIRILRNLASVGLTVSSFAHEVHSLRTRLIPRNEHLIKEISKYLDEDSLIEKGIQKEENPFHMLRLNYQEDLKVKHWLDYSLNSLKRDKRERKSIDVANYFSSFSNTWEKAIHRRKINLVINGKAKNSCKIKAFEVDLDVIFNNLLSNSINAFKAKKGKYDKSITIDWQVKNDSIEMLFYDNGIGLSDEFKKKPNEIFNLFETSKRDKKGQIIGTGLGLYLVKTIVDEYNNTDIQLLQNLDEGFGVKIIFPKYGGKD